MKRYSLIAALVLIAGTSAWGYSLDCFNTSSYLPRCYTPGPCYQPPVCAPQPCYPTTNVTCSTIISSQNAILANQCGTGMAYASNCSSLMIYDLSGCYPSIQGQGYIGCEIAINGFGGFPGINFP